MFQSMRNRDVPPETCARNRYKCMEYVLKRVSYHYIIMFISPRVGMLAKIHSIWSVWCVGVKFHLRVFSTHNLLSISIYKLIQISLLSNPATEFYVIYSGYFQPIYVKLPYKTLHLRVLLVAGGGTRGRPRLRLSPLPFPSALSSLLILQPPLIFNRWWAERLLKSLDLPFGVFITL